MSLPPDTCLKLGYNAVDTIDRLGIVWYKYVKETVFKLFDKPEFAKVIHRSVLNKEI